MPHSAKPSRRTVAQWLKSPAMPSKNTKLVEVSTESQTPRFPRPYRHHSRTAGQGRETSPPHRDRVIDASRRRRRHRLPPPASAACTERQSGRPQPRRVVHKRRRAAHASSDGADSKPLCARPRRGTQARARTPSGPSRLAGSGANGRVTAKTCSPPRAWAGRRRRPSDLGRHELRCHGAPARAPVAVPPSGTSPISTDSGHRHSANRPGASSPSAWSNPSTPRRTRGPWSKWTSEPVEMAHAEKDASTRDATSSRCCPFHPRVSSHSARFR